MERTQKADKMKLMPVNKLMLTMGLPIILSMVLQVVSASVSASAVAQKMKKECARASQFPHC